MSHPTLSASRPPLRHTLVAATLLALGTSALHAAPSDPDAGFGTDGRVTGLGIKLLHSEALSQNRLAVIVNATGSCLPPGNVTGPVRLELAADGAITQAQGQPCDTPVGQRFHAYGALPLPGGGYLVHGEIETTLNLAFIRLLADGRVDTGFGSNGLLTPKIDDAPVLSGTGIRDASRSVIDAQGRIYLSAQVQDGQPAIAAFTRDGALDSTFGNDGLLSLPTNDTVVIALGLRPSDGQLYVSVAARSNPNDNSLNAILRYDRLGQLDSSYTPKPLSRAVDR